MAVLKCPCCGKTADHLAYRNVEAHGTGGEIVTALVLACPECNLVLGASVNPSEYVAAMLRQMTKSRSEGERPANVWTRPVPPDTASMVVAND